MLESTKTSMQSHNAKIDEEFKKAQNEIQRLLNETRAHENKISVLALENEKLVKQVNDW